MIQSIVYDEARVWVQNSYGTVSLFRDNTSQFRYYYHPKAKRWVFLKENARQALNHLASLSNTPAEEVDLAIQNSSKSNEFTKLLTVSIFPIKDDDHKLIAFFSFDWATAQFFRSIGGIFDKNNRAWIIERDIEGLVEEISEESGIPPSSIHYYNEPLIVDESFSSPMFELESLDFVNGEKVLEKRDKEFEEMSMTIVHSVEPMVENLDYDQPKVHKFCKEIGALPHQVEGVDFLLGRSSSLLADDMGLGKTLQSVVVGHFTKGIKIVLCPKSLARNWGNEITKWTGSEDSFFVCPNRRAKLPEGKEWYVFNYEICDKALEVLKLNKTRKVAMVFFDEAHELKNPKSIKSRNAFKVAHKAKNKVIITGTPILNNLNELYTLLLLGGHTIGRTHKRKEFLSEYGSSMKDTRSLKDLLSSWMLRREKSILGSSLPGKTEEIIDLALDGSDKRKYEDITKNPALDTIVKFGALRRLIEEIKVQPIVDKVLTMPEQDKCLIFCEYKDTVERFKDLFARHKIECVTFTGSDSMNKRDQAVESIQEGTAKVFVGNSKAAGVGITLTKASYVFFASLPWTQALKEQAEDRANRIGQTKKVKIYTPIISGTIDTRLKKIIDNKKALSECLIKDDLSPEVKALLLQDSEI